MKRKRHKYTDYEPGPASGQVYWALLMRCGLYGGKEDGTNDWRRVTCKKCIKRKGKRVTDE